MNQTILEGLIGKLPPVPETGIADAFSVNIDYADLGKERAPLPTEDRLDFGDALLIGGPAPKPPSSVKFQNMAAPTPADLKTLRDPFVAEHFELRDGRIVPKFKPLRDIIKPPTGRTDQGWGEDMRRRHLREAHARGWPQFPMCKAHNNTLVICGGGPSLRKNLDRLRKLAKKKSNVVLTLNKTHDFLWNLPKLGLGPQIASWGAVLLDPCDFVQDYITPRPGVQYLLADQCHPDTLEKFADKKISKYIWASTNPAKDRDIVPAGMNNIWGGSTVGMRAITLGYYMGFRKFRLFGYDSSCDVNAESPNGKLHAYEKKDTVGERCTVRITDASGFEMDFVTNSHMGRQADEFLELPKRWFSSVMTGQLQPIHITVHGDGLLPTIAGKLQHHGCNFIKHERTPDGPSQRDVRARRERVGLQSEGQHHSQVLQGRGSEPVQVQA